jgi:Ca-activated chloride channel family protein
MQTARLALQWSAIFVLLLAFSALLSSFLAREVLGVMLWGDGLQFARAWLAPLLSLPPLSVWLARRMQRSRVPRVRMSRSPFTPIQMVASGRGASNPTPIPTPTHPSPRAWWWPRTLRVTLQPLPDTLRAVALLCIGVAMLGPRHIQATRTTSTSGIDMVLTLDASLSMQATDIPPNRFEATKTVVDDFIARRGDDRIGCVIFGRDAYTLLPLTTDHDVLRRVIADLQLGMVDGRGTAIGNAIGVSLNRLRSSKAKSKVMILLTDGDSNSGNIAPEQAASYAKQLGVKVFTLLVGEPDANARAQGAQLFEPRAARSTFPVNPDLLQSIASRTGGDFFQVTDRASLEKSFHAILDRLERSTLQDKGRIVTELFFVFVAPALLWLAIELIIRNTWLRGLP